MRNLQERVKKAFCYQKLFWPFTVWTNCSSDLKNANSRPSALNFKSFSRSLEQFFLTVDQNFGNKIPFINSYTCTRVFFIIFQDNKLLEYFYLFHSWLFVFSLFCLFFPTFSDNFPLRPCYNRLDSFWYPQ